MAIVEIPGGLWIPHPVIPDSNAPSQSGLNTLSVSGEKFAWVFTVPKSGTLDTCEFRVSTVTNNPDNGIDVSFQNVDGAGAPDEVQDQFRHLAGPFSSNTWIVPGLITSDGTDTGTKRTVTAGDRLALVIELTSFVAGDSISFGSLLTAPAGEPLIFCGNQEKTGGAWAKGTNTGPIALKYATDGYIPVADDWVPWLTLNTRTYNSGSTPDERALRFQLPFSADCDGAWLRGDFDGDTDIVLYDSSNSVLASFTIDASARQVTSGVNGFVRWAPVTLAADTTYRLSVKPTTATNIALYDFGINSSGLLAACPGGAQWYTSTRTDAGSWSDDQTLRIWCGLHLSGIDTSGSGGEVSYVFVG